MITAADILDGAAEIIERDGWTQGLAALSGAGQPTCGGIAIDRTAEDLLGVGCWEDEAYEGAHAAMEDAIRSADIIDWNDAPGRTQAEVVSALRRAAEAVR